MVIAPPNRAIPTTSMPRPRRRSPCRLLSGGSHIRVSTRPVSASGTFTKKIDRQPASPTSNPPSAGPITELT